MNSWTTTLIDIKKHHPCSEGWAKLLKSLGKTQADVEPLLLTAVLDSNGLKDTLWALRSVVGHDREIRLFAVWCARQVQSLLSDPRSTTALDVAERYANGQASQTELAAAAAAAAATAATAAADAAAAAAADAAYAAAYAAADAYAAAAYAAADAAADAQLAKLRGILSGADVFA